MHVTDSDVLWRIISGYENCVSRYGSSFHFKSPQISRPEAAPQMTRENNGHFFPIHQVMHHEFDLQGQAVLVDFNIPRQLRDNI